MVISRILALGATLLIAACGGGMPNIRPIGGGSEGVALSRFDKAYAAGKASLQRNHIGLALVLFQKALVLQPESVAALNAVGAAYDELHFPGMAARYYAKALELEPRSADTLNNMAISAALAGRPDQARDLFAAALALDFDNPILRANLGLIERADLAGTRMTGGAEEMLAGGPIIERIGMASFSLTVGRRPSALPPYLLGTKGPLSGLRPELTAMNR
jgi:tetratricopeptide (TPR) repeat protein